ncbi:unnamed protein product [Gongylonema pulchrum]|uniref:SynN domain-containing protein n=1 Tax=Gongylonema pulchrum TaxID=637853 RepID=A0A183E9P4_9BILA|nr:unnamed protein product [Gongylonema pulchrum]
MIERKAKLFWSSDVSIAMDGDADNSSALDSTFFAEINEIRNVLAKLSDDVASMKIRQHSLLAQTIVEEKEKDKLDECISGIKHRAGLLRRHLVAMKTNVEMMGGDKNSSAVRRIRRNHIEALMKKLADLLEMFNAAQIDYRAQVSKRIKRQLDIAGEHLTEDEVNAMVDSKSPQIFNRSVRSTAVRSALDDATSRHNEILNLEASIQELNDLYSDLAFLIHVQVI